MKNYGDLKKPKIELPYYPAIPLLGIYLDKTIISKDTCTPVFIAALFTIVKTWNNLSVHQQVNGHTQTHTHTGILLSHKEGNNPTSHIQQQEWI